ncbi:hypothetical protein FA10DRAFT_172357 [Acaromyces ingoldii]|uniref:Uncharacterized protein n=1 Tax=Acaromyces ingoldii TaxID=215250 RepID=A0A316YJG0_9BASI|nr:hypothetical protein FA10DRAFT_172357 [Acaromyces ingoldii]PWN88748.1 hypothetical protein FA10DRAFT_172357 [Acaromyces ingoldii]
MKTSFAAISVALGLAAFASAGPLRRRDVHCGTTNDATLSDCQALTSDKAIWDAAWAGNTNVCHFTNPLANLYNHDAYNVACHGDCCVYAAGDNAFEDPQGGFTLDRDRFYEEAGGLLGCADASKNKVNGLQNFSDGHHICISNGDGCGDCFDDADYTVA